MNLKVGDIIQVHKLHKGHNIKPTYKLLGNAQIIGLSQTFITIKFENYKDTVPIWDLRKQLYVFYKDGQVIKFDPLSDQKKIEDAKLRKIHEEYYASAGKSEKKAEENRKNGTGVTKAKVLELYNKGLTPDEIVKEFNSTPWIVKGIMAKAGLLSKRGDDSMKLEYDQEKLIELCRIHGTGKEVHAIAAKELNLTERQVENQIFLKGIKRILAQGKNNASSTEVAPVASGMKAEIKKRVDAGEDINTIVESLVAAGKDVRVVTRYAVKFGYVSKKSQIKHRSSSGSQLSAGKVQEEPPVSSLASDIAKELKAVTEEYQNKAAAKKSTLKPVVLKSTETGCEYSFCPDGITVKIGASAFALPYGIIDTFAAELLDLKSMKEADGNVAS